MPSIQRRLTAHQLGAIRGRLKVLTPQTPQK